MNDSSDNLDILVMRRVIGASTFNQSKDFKMKLSFKAKNGPVLATKKKKKGYSKKKHY